MLKEKVIVCVNEKGWINEKMIILWFQKVWNNKDGTFINLKSLLIYDSTRAHLTNDVKILFVDILNLQ